MRVACRALLLAALVATTGCVGTRVAPPSPHPGGTLVMAGGALRADNAAVWRQIVELAGGPGATIAVFGAASDEPLASAQATIATLERYGARAFFVPVATELAGHDVRRDADDPQIAAAVAASGGVFFTGGDQARITRALIASDGRRTAVLGAVWSVYRRGGVIVGTSAGTAIMSETMFSDPDDNVALLRNGVVVGKDVAAGLGFVGPALFVDQHCLARGRYTRMLPAMRATGFARGLCIDEDTAAVVRDDAVEVVGRSAIVALDLRDAAGGLTPDGLRLDGVRISLLVPGDRYAVDDGAMRAAARRTRRLSPPGAQDAARPRTTPPVVDDVAAPGALNALLRAVVADRSEVVARLRGTTAAGGSAAFDFRFHADERSTGFCDEAPASACTIIDVALDVSPSPGPAAPH